MFAAVRVEDLLRVLVAFLPAPGQVPGSQGAEKEQSVVLQGHVWYRRHPVGGVEVTLRLNSIPSGGEDKRKEPIGATYVLQVKW